ncbi:unnamed protein product [Closterium sp. Yama58-4]|nr:unnamed protein product [Closterium sp. Yama58-4]
MAGQAIYVPADDLTDPAPATTIAHLDATPPLCCLARRPKKGSITSVQAIYVPADTLTDPAPATTVAHLDATTVAHLDATTVAHLDATTVAHLDATTVAHLDATTFAHLDATTFAHLDATTVLSRQVSQCVCCKLLVAGCHVKGRGSRGHGFLSQPFHVAEVFIASAVKYADVNESITSFEPVYMAEVFTGWPFTLLPLSCLFSAHSHNPLHHPIPSQGVLDGKYDDLPEQGQAFYRVGGIEEVVVVAKAEKLAKELSS